MATSDSPATRPDDVADELYDLAPSAKLVLVVLEEEGPLTQDELVDETMLLPRTCRYALDQLAEVDAIEEGVNWDDLRKTAYEAAVEDGDRDG